jgi:hypothetical protein
VLPPESILKAAVRWADLLERSAYAEASALLRSETKYADLTPTQYNTALEWLTSLEIAELGQTGTGYRLAPAYAGLPREQRSLFLFTRALEEGDPPWLQDADALVPTADEMPEDGALLASVLELAPETALTGIRQVHGHIDLELRARIGAAGERELVRLLESNWPGSTTHISLDHDGWGYDIAFRDEAGREWHLEVKSTPRRGRLVVHLSRQEHDVAGTDRNWRLIVVGLDDNEQIQALATAKHSELLQRSPRDIDRRSRWQSARVDLRGADLEPGLHFLPGISTRHGLLTEGVTDQESFAWMPTAVGDAHAVGANLTPHT